MSLTWVINLWSVCCVRCLLTVGFRQTPRSRLEDTSSHTPPLPASVYVKAAVKSALLKFTTGHLLTYSLHYKMYRAFGVIWVFLLFIFHTKVFFYLQLCICTVQIILITTVVMNLWKWQIFGLYFERLWVTSSMYHTKQPGIHSDHVCDVGLSSRPTIQHISDIYNSLLHFQLRGYSLTLYCTCTLMTSKWLWRWFLVVSDIHVRWCAVETSDWWWLSD